MEGGWDDPRLVDKRYCNLKVEKQEAWLLDRECGCASVTVLLLLRWGSDRAVWILAPGEIIVWVSMMTVRMKIYGLCMLEMVTVKLSF
jgi:hypothetical protein